MSRTKGVNQIRWDTAFLMALAMLIALTALWAKPACAAGKEPVKVTVGHFAPFSDSAERAKLDVTIDGKKVADDLGYLEQVQTLALATGTRSIVVEPTEWAAGAFTDTFDIPAPDSSNLVNPGVLLAINGGTSDIPLNVDAMAIEQAPPAGGALIRFTQLAPYALDGDSEYTVCNPDGTTFNGMTMVKFGTKGDYTAVAADSYSLYLAGSHGLGCEGTPLSPIMTIVVAEGAVGDFIAVGTNAPPPWKTDPPFPIQMKLITVQTQASAGAVVLDQPAYLPLMMQR